MIKLEQLNSNKTFFVVTFSFLIINAVATAFEFYWLNFLPIILTVITLFFFSLDRVFFLIVFFTPLSVNLENKDFNLGLSLPTEPLMIALMLIFSIRLVLENNYDKQIFKHPVTKLVLFNIFWIAFTSLTSSIPMVSFKFLLSKLWFIITGYFFAIQVFKNISNMRKFLWIFSTSLAIVATYTLIMHSQKDFNERTSHWIMYPFFNDHTSYGAILAMFFPFAIGFLVSKYSSNTNKIFAFIFLFIFTFAIIFSYTRAAWVSLIAVLIMLIFMKFRVKLIYLFGLLGLVVIVLLFNQDKLLSKLEKNTQDSSDNLQEHVASISNISSDASNLERLNRWNCALRMFMERPIFGWGPGTYSFQYAPFQKEKERTIISTNNGDGGNAHSEYLGPLCEQGVIGTVSFISIIFSVVFLAFRLYYNSKNNEVRLLTIVCFLGFFTYVVHGFLNNFLDTDKASIPFWGFISIMVAMELYHENKEKNQLT